MIFTSPVAAEHDVVRLQVGVTDAAAVHVDQARRRSARRSAPAAAAAGAATVSSVLPLTYSISRWTLRTRNSQSRCGLQGVDLDQVGMVEHLGDAELVLGLVEELVVLLAVDRHDLEGVVLGSRRCGGCAGWCCGRPARAVPTTWNLPMAEWRS